MSASSQKTIKYRGRYGRYETTKEKAAAHTAWLKTPEGRDWEHCCIQSDREYASTMHLFEGGIAE